MANWINRTYPYGARVVTPEGKGWVTNHTCEGGFKGTTITGIMVELDNGEYLEFPDDMLSEDGLDPDSPVRLYSPITLKDWDGIGTWEGQGDGNFVSVKQTTGEYAFHGIPMWKIDIGKPGNEPHTEMREAWHEVLNYLANYVNVKGVVE